MAAKIRLKRVGRKGQPSYRIVVLDGQKPRDAKVVEDLGSYDPKTNPPVFEVDSEAALKWLLDGAKATSAARSVLSMAGVMAAWDAAKRGETITIEPKELKPSTKRKKKEALPADETKAEEPAAEEPSAKAESEAPAKEEAIPAEGDAVEETPQSEETAAEESEVEEESSAADEAPEAEGPADDAEEEAKEEA